MAKLPLNYRVEICKILLAKITYPEKKYGIYDVLVRAMREVVRGRVFSFKVHDVIDDFCRNRPSLLHELALILEEICLEWRYGCITTYTKRRKRYMFRVPTRFNHKQ